ncbi:Two-component response regulator [Bacillus cereus Rock4-18]|nr:Two-component response regulator [Bacillus cereus Rock4-18]
MCIKDLVNKEDLKCYVEQRELLKREYLFEEFGKILQG